MIQGFNVDYDSDNDDYSNNDDNKPRAQNGRNKDALLNIISIYPGIVQTEIYKLLKMSFKRKRRTFEFALQKLEQSGKIVRTLQEGKGGKGNTPSYKCYLSEIYCHELLNTEKIDKKTYDGFMEHLKSIADCKELNRPSLINPAWKNTTNLFDNNNSLNLPKREINAIKKNSDIIDYIKNQPGQTRNQIREKISGRSKGDLDKRFKILYKYSFIKYLHPNSDENPLQRESMRHRNHKVLLGPAYFVYMKSQQMPKEELTDLMVTHDINEDNIKSYLHSLKKDEETNIIVKEKKQKYLKRKRENDESDNDNNLPENLIPETKKPKETIDKTKTPKHVLDAYYKHSILTKAARHKELEMKKEVKTNLENAILSKHKSLS